MDRTESVDQIAQALSAAGCGYIPEITRHFAEVALAIALPEGPYGLCSTAGCRNPATHNSGVNICNICSEASSYGTRLALANSDLARYGLVFADGWLEKLEERIRHNVAVEQAAMGTAG